MPSATLDVAVSLSEGRTWVSVAGPLRRMPRRHRLRSRRGTHRDEDEPCHAVSTRAGAADGTPGATALDPVSVRVSSDEDDDVPACDSNASVDPDDTIADTDVEQECHLDQVSVSSDKETPLLPPMSLLNLLGLRILADSS